jgi:hypothetical protein
VRKAIQRAIQQIDEADHTVGQVLRASIATGATCIYAPDAHTVVTWRTHERPTDATSAAASP